MLKYLFSFLLVVIVDCFYNSLKASAQETTGCLYGGYIYYTPDGTSGGYPNYKKAPQGARIDEDDAFCVQAVSGNCRIDKKSSQTGTLKTFYTYQCPIDDYVPLFILLIGGFAFFTLRNLKYQAI